MLRISNLNPREKGFLLVMLVAVLLGAILPSRLSLALGESVRHKLFFLGGRPVEHRIQAGDYLVFPYDGHRLTKFAACLPGDRLNVIEGEFFCNGEFLGRALTVNSLGEPLPQWQFNGVVPTGRVFMSGHHQRSYDSRYMGFIDIEEITHKAYPLWPFW
ncbi:S26 family signal peptidase [Desulfurivibrio sp. D14AmB]|uniref:S26 family signal peptidase n=1 Tax=Desulfurivibrio sp. D14AmB TaxID=3374370 RepID=UPI00376ECA3E